MGVTQNVAVTFDNIAINDCYELVNGKIELVVDPNKQLLDVDDAWEGMQDLLAQTEARIETAQTSIDKILALNKNATANKQAILDELAKLKPTIDSLLADDCRTQAFKDSILREYNEMVAYAQSRNARLAATNADNPITKYLTSWAERLLTPVLKCVVGKSDVAKLIHFLVEETERNKSISHVTQAGLTGSNRCIALVAEGFVHELFSNADALGIAQTLKDFSLGCLSSSVRFFQTCINATTTNPNVDQLFNCILGPPCGPRLLLEATPQLINAASEFGTSLLGDCSTSETGADISAYNRGVLAAFIATIVIPSKWVKLSTLKGQQKAFGALKLTIKNPEEAIALFKQGKWKDGIKTLFGKAGYIAAKFPKVNAWLEGVTNASKKAELQNIIQTWDDELLGRLDNALGNAKYSNLATELTANQTLLDYFKQLNTNWYARFGLARAYSLGSGTAGKIALPNHFKNYMLDLELLPGYRVVNIYNSNRAPILELGIKFDDKIKDILTTAFRKGRAGIEAADIPVDLRNIYLRLWDDGYTKAIQNVRLKTANGVEFIPDLLFFRTRQNGVLSFNQVVYHDAKIDVSTLFTDGQDAAIVTIETAKNTKTVAQFWLVNNLSFENNRYLANQPLTLKEVSKVATQTTSGQVNLVRRIEIEQ